MSYRNETQNVLKLIGDMEARIAKLEKGNMGIKQQDVRIGDKLLSDSDDLGITVSDLSTGTSFRLPSPFEVIFSYPDAVDTAGEVSGVYTVDTDSTATEIVVNVLTPDTGIIQVTIYFGAASETVALPSNSTSISQSISQGCTSSTRIYAEMTSVGDATATELTATVRFTR